MKKLIIIASSFFVLIVYMAVREKIESSSPIHCKHVNRISDSFLDVASEKYGLTCSGSGGALMDKVNSITLVFDSREENVPIERARSLFVKSLEDYLSRINDDEKLRPYLSDYPFTQSGVNFRISFQATKKDEIYLVFLSHGKIIYMTKDENQAPLVKVSEETYEEAREIVIAERSSTM
ncbi:hypothetical protein [Candidatus Neptunichlamydia sp. REUL1]|uniref:hypothetical protein n=1 Tax=Candidatus Neptunichlamydia sp. REUL1 TaxID=3064277 RepID=UPI00292FAEB6|nr:hypothetical protein [Candidatus Neptunochlamydia sp. REUL1]